MVAGTALGIALRRFRGLDRWLHPWLIILLNISSSVIIIPTSLWLGLVETALSVAVAANKIPNVAVTLREGARALEKDFAEVAQIDRFRLAVTVRDITIPQLAPDLLAAGRSGLALIWKILLVVELLGRSNRVDFQLRSCFQLFDVTRIVAYTAAFVHCVLLIELTFLLRLSVRSSNGVDEVEDQCRPESYALRVIRLSECCTRTSPSN